MRATESFLLLKNQTAVTSAAVTVNGGAYVFDVVATGSGSVTLERVGPDGSTTITAATAITATGSSGLIYLPPGQYMVVTTGLTAVYARLTRVPLE